MNEDDVRAEIRARLMAIRAFHPGPWRVEEGVLVDHEGNAIDVSITAVGDFFEHVLDDLTTLTATARRRSDTRDLRRVSPGLRPPSAPSDPLFATDDVRKRR